jgi:hypothetical protein
MSDPSLPSSPSGSSPEPELDPQQLRDDLAALAELAADGVEVDGEVQVTESTWVLYGHTSYDGEVIVGEYHDVVEATEVLHFVTPDPAAATDPGPDDAGTGDDADDERSVP